MTAATGPVLALDTACDACSAAVWRDGALLAREFQAMARGQSEALVPMVERVMAQAGLAFDDLAGIGVTVGPGAFTGLRIGLAAARAFALASGKPAVGVTTLEAIAAAVPAAPGALVVAIDAKRDDLYVQTFAGGSAWTPAGDPAALLPAMVATRLPEGPFLIAGDGASRLHAALSDAARARATLLSDHAVPDAAVVARLAALRLAGASLAATPPRPLYLRPPDAKLPQDGGRLRPLAS
ncbi:MAG TPA: tRNA (adenosine(37)-N6)-threonylcarbamoyltransferase complex dimerization subunit type 1 TsaB [Alphaproteobacteria bacterium]|jgi:tRNA threonylcarbamoyladenosine biosynthesis protein TsaB